MRRSLFATLVAGLILSACATSVEAHRHHRAPNPLVEGRALANGLLHDAPLPPGALRVNHASAPLVDAIGQSLLHNLVWIHRDYVVNKPFDLAAFVRSHFAAYAQITGPDSAAGTNMTPVIGYGVVLTRTNRHVSLEELDYTVNNTTNGVRELRVDALALWLPIKVVVMPAGTVSLTAYGNISLSSTSSDPVTVSLTSSQTSRLRTLIEGIREAPGGMCMENSDLFTIKLWNVASVAPVWSALGVACPSVLAITTHTADGRAMSWATLEDTCQLTSFLRSVLPVTARAARRNIVENCVAN